MNKISVLTILFLMISSALSFAQSPATSESSASLLIHEDLSGRITIRDNLDFIVSELTKPRGHPLTLGIEPGQYRILLEQGDNFYRAELTLLENSTTTLSMGDFELIAAAPGSRRRVSEGEPEPGGWRNPFGNSLYTFVLNIVDEDFRYPLIGFFNLAIGNFNSFQMGFVNWNTRNLSGIQASYINIVGGNFSGIQAGFINTVAGDTNGFQTGFVNTTRGLNGFQAGFVNTATNNANGFQLGFVNVSTRALKGVQLGFVNYADSIDGGVPFGFISIVREGGYRAIEYSFSEFYPITLGFKIGVEKFYTSFFGGVNPLEENSYNRVAFGWGFGSIIPMGSFIFFNPEFINLNARSEGYWDGEDGEEYYSRSFSRSYSLVFNLGFNVNHNFSITVGPSITWLRFERQESMNQLFSLFYHDISEDSAIAMGLMAGLRFKF